MKYVGLALLLVSGCAFHVDGDNAGGAGGDMSLPVDDLGGGGSGGGGGGGGSAADLATPNDIAGVPIVCTAGSSSCNGSTLETCPDGTAQMMTTCPLGCSNMGGPHCELMYPRAPVSRTDFDTTGLSAITITVGGGIGTDNGQINAGAAVLRPANTNPSAYEVHSGIGFHVVSIPGQTGKMGIYTFKSLTVAQGQSLNAYGGSALALVSAGDMTIDGTVDVTCAGNVFLAGGGPNAKPYLAGPGGGNGGLPGANNSGVAVQPGGGGAGADNTHLAGGGGGAFGDVGGAGGAQMNNAGGAGGAAYGDALLTMLVGGSGGGAGGQGPAPTTNGSFGGGGGGVALLIAQGTLTIGAGTALGGVNAGGCGGTADNGVGGGGGGAGGAILLQGIAVHVAAMGGVAANGGGGSASDMNPTMMSNGKAGAISTTAAAGGSGGSASGGAGGVAGATAGQAGNASDNGGSGGGGGVGRIRIESQAGSATLDTGAIASPAPAQGMLDIH